MQELIDILDRSAGRGVFFVPTLANLVGRSPEILKAAKEERLPHPSRLLGKDDLYRAVNVNEGMTLWAALKVIETIEKLGRSRKSEHRDLVSYRGAPMQFESGCIIPSLLHIEPTDLRAFFNGRNYMQFATEVFGGGIMPNAIRLLEVGERANADERSYTEFRVTMRFAARFISDLNGVRHGQTPIRIDHVFSPDPMRGPRNGQNTRALRKANGNLIEMVRATPGPCPPKNY
jgi:hypothetical protein